MFLLEPHFFDIFGAIGFIYILILALFGLFGKRIPRWAFFILLLMGIAGALLDTLVVYMFYLK
jgi:uncharacterized membrane protein